MDKLILTCILFTVICYRGILSQSNDNETRIVGGNPTTIQAYPYQALVRPTNLVVTYQCGGSIINKNTVVCAGHCLVGMVSVDVIIGSTSSSSGGTKYTSLTFFIHPKYNALTNDYDVSVIKIPLGMSLDGINARAINLVASGSDPTDSDMVVVTGWGTTSEGGTVSDTLMVTQLPIINRTVCNQILNGGVTLRMMCAGFPQGGKDTCQGDSGGPAVLTSNNLLTGITSFGNGCARAGSPGVYAFLGNSELNQFVGRLSG